ncbi:DUF6779 domain-containing protein [Mycolicibacterium alvei]|uniref:DUF6779 domain-containing protein n=1 Tax=Mycolicibacterium alvei TaxID=67081 RepID=UPI0015D19DC2|nr:DUF6779 domain-containing protein [Mycolicibacterium alvei]MCV7002416.1 hypothetical protein [Mycolicibacterium alvei]
MSVLPRGGRPRRGGRRPGWLLLTVLLVLAILASSALVFTDRVELLKLAVILALWAAVVAAFVSVIYRRQSDLDQAKARDLKFVYDLQLDREISARREYELTVETQLRRELASELRAQAADEVAALRSELAALRTNLEILFDTDLVHRPALETDKSAVRTTGRVTASRLDVPPVEVTDIRMSRTQESPIIDVPAEPHPPENDWATAGGAHRLPSRPMPAGDQPRRRRRQPEPARPEPARPEPQPAARRQPEPPSTWAPPPPPPAMPPMQPSPTIEAPQPEPSPLPEPPAPPEPVAEPAAAGWRPAPAEGQWIPAGVPGSNWSAPPAQSGAATEYVGRRRAPEAAPVPPSPPEPEPTPAPAMSPGPAPEPPRGRHSGTADPGRPEPAQPSPALATESSQPPEPPRRASRHRSDNEPEPPNGHHADGQSVSELLARFQSTPVEGGRRRRREE